MIEISTVAGYYGKSPRIVWEKISEYSNRRELKFNLMEIFDNERELSDGRFANFSHDPQELKVTIRLGRSEDDIKINMRRCVEWIATQTRQPWSFDIKYTSMSHPLDMVFSFADVTAAVLFKLVWYRPLR